MVNYPKYVFSFEEIIWAGYILTNHDALTLKTDMQFRNDYLLDVYLLKVWILIQICMQGKVPFRHEFRCKNKLVIRKS